MWLFKKKRERNRYSEVGNSTKAEEHAQLAGLHEGERVSGVGGRGGLISKRLRRPGKKGANNPRFVLYLRSVRRWKQAAPERVNTRLS